MKNITEFIIEASAAEKNKYQKELDEYLQFKFKNNEGLKQDILNMIEAANKDLKYTVSDADEYADEYEASDSEFGEALRDWCDGEEPYSDKCWNILDFVGGNNSGGLSVFSEIYWYWLKING